MDVDTGQAKEKHWQCILRASEAYNVNLITDKFLKTYGNNKMSFILKIQRTPFLGAINETSNKKIKKFKSSKIRTIFTGKNFNNDKEIFGLGYLFYKKKLYV